MFLAHFSLYEAFQYLNSRNTVSPLPNLLTLVGKIHGYSDQRILEQLLQIYPYLASPEDNHVKKSINIVRNAYQSILKRDPDVGGLNFYVGQLQTNQINEQKLMIVLKNSSEYKLKNP